MDVLALFGWRTCRETPFKNSFSSASLPTRRSRAAMRASYSASTSAAAVSLSSPPASNLATQILIRLRPIPWRLARACSDSPPRNSWTTWRLNSIECVRCLAMGFLLESPVQLADSHLPHLSTPRGALHWAISRSFLVAPSRHQINGGWSRQVKQKSGRVLRQYPPFLPLSLFQPGILKDRRERCTTAVGERIHSGLAIVRDEPPDRHRSHRMGEDPDRGMVDAGCGAEQNHSVLCSQLCRRL